jgi:hypothetical protein
MNARVKTEHAEAVALMKLVKLHEGRYPDLQLFAAVPNGGDRHPIVAAKMKHEGVRAGYPDYLLDVPRGDFHGLRIELKSATGYTSREQKKWIERLRANGYRVEVCRGAEAAWGVLCEYLDISRGGTINGIR